MEDLIRTIWTSKKTIVDQTLHIGRLGEIFYDGNTGDLRLSDGSTPGGLPLLNGGSGGYTLPKASNTVLGGVKIGANISIDAFGTISVASPFSGDYNDLTNIPDPEEEMPYAKRIDFITDTLLYKGEALPGSADDSPVWRLHRLTIGSDDDIIEVWANGVSDYIYKWTDRLTFTYS